MSAPPLDGRPAPRPVGLRIAAVGLGLLVVGLAVVLLSEGAGAAIGGALAAVAAAQAALARELQALLLALRDGTGTPFALIAGSFVYGVLHAAGPGHGKVVLTAYLATQPTALARGVGLAAAAALLQGGVAIALVGVLVLVLGAAAQSVQGAALWVERASYALVAGLGLLVVVRSVARGRAAARHPAHDVAGGAADHAGCAHHAGCVHHGLPADRDDRRDRLAVVLAIGLRPCSGALIVLVAAHLIGLTAAGVAAVVAMSAGTALAVGLLAVLAVKARQWAHRLAEAGTGGHRQAVLALFGAAAGVAGGLIILLAGAALMAGSFQPAHPLGAGGPLG